MRILYLAVGFVLNVLFWAWSLTLMALDAYGRMSAARELGAPDGALAKAFELLTQTPPWLPALLASTITAAWIGAGWWLFVRRSANGIAGTVKPMQPMAPPDAASRVFVPAGTSPGDLVEPFESHTSADAEALVAKYIGRWMSLKGQVYQLSKAGPGTVLLLHTEHFMLGPRVHLFFHGDHAARAAMLGKGASFAAMGRISEIGSLGVVLENCEFEG